MAVADKEVFMLRNKMSKILKSVFVCVVCVSAMMLTVGCEENKDLFGVSHGQLVRISNKSQIKPLPSNSPIFKANPLVCDILTPKEYSVNGYPKTIFFVDFANKKIYNVGGDLLYDKEIVNMTKQSISIIDRFGDSKSSINIDLQTGFYTEMTVTENTNDERYSSGFCRLNNSIKDLDVPKIDF